MFSALLACVETIRYFVWFQCGAEHSFYYHFSYLSPTSEKLRGAEWYALSLFLFATFVHQILRQDNFVAPFHCSHCGRWFISSWTDSKIGEYGRLLKEKHEKGVMYLIQTGNVWSYGHNIWFLKQRCILYFICVLRRSMLFYWINLC